MFKFVDDGDESKDSLLGRSSSCIPDEPVVDKPKAKVACLSSFLEPGLLLEAGPLMAKESSLFADSGGCPSTFGGVFQEVRHSWRVVGDSSCFLTGMRGLGGRMTDRAIRWMYMCRCLNLMLLARDSELNSCWAN